ncbi:hypothetical protein Celaphus_00017563 [Cervus elaphus hippelaphus]|uniref:C2H2-type domain-containing protein n=1 Tax=Cervus elaphus hippelaphus TaxID=46360 RepID=A0A212C6T6_CEREH|nr:hypothetical protein Celaphus_00017563 [Cervus elaphus hippelaphus]
MLSNGDQSHTLGHSPSGRAAGEPGAGITACVSVLESSSRDAPRRPEPPRCSVDLKTPACGPQQEGLSPRDAADLPPRQAPAAGLQPPSESQAAHPRERLPDLHTREHPAAGKRAPAPDLVPLDLSERSSRDDPGRREPASSLQAALAVHPCPYCSHKTYYPEVLWMHKRVWHRVSGQAVAPQWTQPNGYKSIRSNLVFLARSGRTGPPPALGGKECQPLPISRFTRTQGSEGLMMLASCPPLPRSPHLRRPPGTLRTQAHQGDFICVECGKSFHQPSHLRAHMRAHTVLFESNGLRGADARATSADAPKQHSRYLGQGETILTQMLSTQCLSEREPRDTLGLSGAVTSSAAPLHVPTATLAAPWETPRPDTTSAPAATRRSGS